MGKTSEIGLLRHTVSVPRTGALQRLLFRTLNTGFLDGWGLKSCVLFADHHGEVEFRLQSSCQ